VSLSAPAVHVAVGADHTCALTVDGRVWCWGHNDHGQLGDGTFVDRSLPVPVPGLSDVEQLDAGGFFSCAVTRARLIYCWGANEAGQLGDGTLVDRPTPTFVKLPP
jgi:alpha-tubulin suppressor-like RCC1 family protein